MKKRNLLAQQPHTTKPEAPAVCANGRQLIGQSHCLTRLTTLIYIASNWSASVIKYVTPTTYHPLTSIDHFVLGQVP